MMPVDLTDDERKMIARLVRFSGLNPWTPAEVELLASIAEKMETAERPGVRVRKRTT